ncbi:Alpha 1,3 fucosyltransferase [Mortierella sp. AM989]|nr:Alpha 1,3 fucosyltransferase [Mortierella sp. AM989]
MPETHNEPSAASESQTDTKKILKSKEISMTDYPILWWTSLQSQATPPTILGDCGLDYTCTFSQDKNLLDKASIVLFQDPQMNANDIPTSRRNSYQAWILNDVYNLVKSPERTDILSASLLPFTHSWSYKFESDFVETLFQPSSTGLSVTTSNALFESDAFLDMVTAPPRVDLAEKNRLRALAKEQGGRAPLVWIVEDNGAESQALGNECKDSPSGRENYVRELAKLIDIDIYGPCLSNTPWPVHDDTQKPFMPQEIMAQYKFTLALERVNCEDYVTSSLADALAVGAIPIVDGPKDYSRFSPTDDALIQISSFIAPEPLAQELDALDRNDTQYINKLGYRKRTDTGASMEGLVQQQELAPTFKKAFGMRKGHTIDAAAAENGSSFAAWGPDRHGAYCGVCQLAHDISEEIYDWKAVKKFITSSWSKDNCESEPRYLPGLPTQMNAYDDYLQLQNEKSGGATRGHSIDVTIIFDKSKQKEPSVVPPLNLDTWIQSGDLEENIPLAAIQQQQQLSPEFKALSPSEMYYLLMLIILLCVGMIALGLITSKSARKFAMWPWRHMFYSKIPEDDQEAQSLERVMLRELGDDLVYQ